MNGAERAALPDALIVPGGILADDIRRLHLNAEMFFRKINGSEDRKEESRLQQRGPPTAPMAARDLAVIRWDKEKGSCERGVDPEMMETNMPELMPAPQAPQKPQAPPGTLFPRLIISSSACSRQILPPAFL